jgi:hypothetical protein
MLPEGLTYFAVQLYLTNMSHKPGIHAIIFWIFILGGIFVTDLLNSFQTWYLGYWASQYDDHDSSDVPVFQYVAFHDCQSSLWLTMT